MKLRPLIPEDEFRLLAQYPLRFNMLQSGRKPLLAWLWEFRLMLPHRVWSSEGERYHWRRSRWPDQWLYTEGPKLMPGDTGYETATHEVRFLMGPKTHTRFVPETPIEHS